MKLVVYNYSGILYTGVVDDLFNGTSISSMVWNNASFAETNFAVAVIQDGASEMDARHPSLEWGGTWWRSS